VFLKRKGRKVIRSAVILSLLIAGTYKAGVTPQSTNIIPAQEAVAIKNEPHNRLKFENSFVRVWETSIPTGDATKFHVHAKDLVVISLTDTHLRDETVGKVPSESTPTTGEVSFRKAPFVHRVINIGESPYHNIAVELLKRPYVKPTKAPEPGNRTLVLENDSVLVFRMALDPGQSTGMQSHLPPALIVSMSDAQIETETPDKHTEVKSLQPGDVQFRIGPLRQSLKNTGSTRFEALEIEVK
jgi:hypothetical protein